MTGSLRVLLLLAVIGLSAAWATSAAEAQDAAALEIAGVRVGFGDQTVHLADQRSLQANCYKPGLWTPVEVAVRGPLPATVRVSLTVPDGDGVPSRVVTNSPEVLVDGSPQAAGTDSPGGSTAGPQSKLQLFARFGRVKSDLRIEIHNGDELLAKRVFQANRDAGFPVAKPSDSELVVAIGLTDEQAAGLVGRRSKETIVALVEDLDRLPDAWYGYEGVDSVLLATGDSSAYLDLEPDGRKLAALDEWIRLGGKLLLSVGRNAEEVCRPDSPLAQFVPGEFKEMITLRQAASLEAYSNSDLPISSTGGGRFALEVPLLGDVTGAVEVSDSALPLVVRSARGLGQIVFLAFDPELPPFDTWGHRGRLVDRLLGRAPEELAEAEDNSAVMHYGFTDMAGHLRSALDNFSGVRTVPFALVVTLVVLYVLAIGPGDYFFLRKVARRMLFTWVTFPLIVAVVGVGAYMLAYRFKGDEVRLNQVDLVDVDVESGIVRGTTWANIFSPKMERYNLALEPRLPSGKADSQAESITGWFGLPGDALGGMDPKTTDPVAWKGQYDFGERLDSLDGVPIPVWSSKSFTARWSSSAAEYPQAELADDNGLPVGAITNTFGFPLADALLVYGRWAYQLGTIEPGAAAYVGASAKRRELRTLLTGQRMIFDKAADRYLQRATPYDLDSTDPAYILRAMTFFRDAEGRQYTQLVNRYQAFVDLSPMLTAGRAVLVAQAPEQSSGNFGPGAWLLSDGRPLAGPQDKHSVVYRFVLPVQAQSQP